MNIGARESGFVQSEKMPCAPRSEDGARLRGRHANSAGGLTSRPHTIKPPPIIRDALTSGVDMRLAHILVCHTVDPTPTIESIPHEANSLWYVFLHSANAEIERKVEALMAARGGRVLAYRTNRGLGRSWNEGLHLAFEAGCDAVMLVNDDLHFIKDGYARFRSYSADLLGVKDDVAYITPLGLERELYEGRIHPQNFACCIIPKRTVEKIGFFDEAFSPAYFEDMDFSRRAHLFGLRRYIDDEACLCEHKRSSTVRSASQDQQRAWNAAIDCNAAYFARKWGGLFPSTFGKPFNDPSASLAIPLSRTSIGAAISAGAPMPAAKSPTGGATLSGH